MEMPQYPSRARHFYLVFRLDQDNATLRRIKRNLMTMSSTHFNAKDSSVLNVFLGPTEKHWKISARLL